MRKLLCLLLTLLFLPVATAAAEGMALSIDTPAEAIRPGKAFLLSFSVPAAGECDLLLRDVTGNFVMNVVTDLSVNAGRNQLWWNGTSGGVSPAEGLYQLALIMDGAETLTTVVIGSHAPYLTSIVPVKDADRQTLTVDFYTSVDGLLTVGLWSGNIWSLLENRQVTAGMNQVVWDASAMTQNTTALTLTLTDSTGFSSNEEHINLRPEDFGIMFSTPTPRPAAAATEYVLTPMRAATATPAPTEAAELPGEDEDADVPVPEAEATVVPPAAPAEESAAEPVVEPAVEPVVESTAEPAEEPAAEPTVEPVAEPTAAPTEEPAAEPTVEPVVEPTAEPAEELADSWDDPIDIDHSDAEAAELSPTATPVPATVYTPSYGSPYPLTEKDKATYWGTPMDITDEEAIWTMLTAPFTYYKVKNDAANIQRKIYAEPSDKSRQIGVITCTSQAVRVIEELDNGWSLIETYSSTFHDNSVDAWNMLIQGYVKTSNLRTRTVDKKYHIVVDKLTQRLYLFGEGKLLTTLLVSTGLSNEKQPYNETRSGDFLYSSPTGGFWSDNMFAPLGMKFNDGDLLHEVPYVQRKGSKTKIYASTEPFLGQRASHGCIRVQRKKNADGYNMQWIWDNRKELGRIVVWEDWQGRQIPYPADDTVLYYNPDGGSYYHKEDHCDSAKDTVQFAPFTYGELESDAYAKLDFCPYCAPALRRAEIEKVNEAHAIGGDHDPILTAARQKWLNKVIKDYGYEALTDAEKRYYLGEKPE